MMQNEKSRAVKMFYIKFKCIIVMSIAFIALLEFVYIIVKDIFSSSQITGLLNAFMESQMGEKTSDDLRVSSPKSFSNASLL